MTAHCKPFDNVPMLSGNELGTGKPCPEEYAPYHHYAEFWHAVADYDIGRSAWIETTGERRQAHDCGIQYAIRLARWVEGRNAA